MNQKVMITGLFFFFVFLFGFWVSRSGKPYNVLIFNIHKLSGLAMGIFLIIIVYQTHRAAPFNPLDISVIVITVIIFICLVAAGGVLSIEAAGNLENTPQSIKTMIAVIHKVFPYLALLSTAFTLYLLLFRKT